MGAGLRRDEIWATSINVGGSVPFQGAGSAIVIEGSGTSADITATNLVARVLLSGGQFIVGGSIVAGGIVSGAQFLTAGSLTAGGNIIGGASISGTNVYAQTAMQADTVRADVTLSGVTLGVRDGAVAGSLDLPEYYDNPGSPYATGRILQFTAEVIISGGMWVVVSGAAGGAALLARPAPASAQSPLGVAPNTAGSNTTVNVLTQGIHYFIAEDTISNGHSVEMGAGAALNTVHSVLDGSGARGVALAGAGSEGQTLVYLW